MNAEDWDRDHVPPRRFYPRELRAQSRIRLITAFTHPSCNRAYQGDEDYFFAALVPIAAALDPASIARCALQDLERSLGRPQGVRLQQTLPKVPADLGIVDANGFLGRLDHRRLNRIVWKIVRGLADGVSSIYLPESAEHSVVLSAVLPMAGDGATSLRSFPGDQMNAFSFDHSLQASRSVWRLAFWTQLLAVVTYHERHGQPKTLPAAE